MLPSMRSQSDTTEQLNSNKGIGRTQREEEKGRGNGEIAPGIGLQTGSQLPGMVHRDC